MSIPCFSRTPVEEHSWDWNPQGTAAACKKCDCTRVVNQGPAVVSRTATVHYKKMKASVRFTSFVELTEKIEKIEKWMKVLKFSHYELRYEFDNSLHPIPEDLHGVPTENLTIVVRVALKGFSVAASGGHELALSSLDSLFKTVDHIPRSDAAFPECGPNVISKETFDAAAQRVVEELKTKARATNLDIASEYTMREFISPVLIAVVILVIEHRAKSPTDDSKLSMVCDRMVMGMNTHGPVDYVILFDFIDLVLSEAKKDNIVNGIVQCLLQQRASQEFLANTLMDLKEWGASRKRKFEEVLNVVRSIPSYGITSTGSKWVLSTTSIETDVSPFSDSKQTAVVLSNYIEIDLKNPEKGKLSSLLSRITAIVLKLISAVKSNEKLMEAGGSLCSNVKARMNVFVKLQTQTAEVVKRLLDEDMVDEDMVDEDVLIG